MKVSEYNNLVNEIADLLKPLNQLLYQILIIIAIYYFYNLNYGNNDLNDWNNKKTDKSFIILFAFIAVCLDWFIWNNYTQTILFISILTIYIYYNFKNLNIISTFIKLAKDLNEQINTQSNVQTDSQIDSQADSQAIAQCDIPLISISNDFINKPKIPLPYDTNNIDTKNIDIQDGIQDGIQDIHILGIQDTYENADFELINSFRNQKKNFLDKQWLNSRTYNDNCNSCKTNSTTNKYVKYGRELSNCTNQEGTINNDQLENISTNIIKPYKF